MRAISLWEPWATLVAIGAKEYETRSWRHYLRYSWVVICAAKRKPDADDLCLLEEHPDYVDALRGEKLSFGCAVCLVRLGDCIRTEEVRVSEREWAFGDYSPNRYAWELKDLVRLEIPVPVKGKQGFFYLTHEEKEALNAQLWKQDNLKMVKLLKGGV